MRQSKALSQDVLHANKSGVEARLEGIFLASPEGVFGVERGVKTNAVKDSLEEGSGLGSGRGRQ